MFRRDSQNSGVKVGLDLMEADHQRLWNRLPEEVKHPYRPNFFDEYE
jgi:hypothetical protein